MACPRVLITGFGPFPGAAENSSAWLAEALAAAGAPSGCTLHTEVLPTEWTEVATLGPRLLRQHRPRLILHLGLSRNAKGFRIERSAHNVIDFREDAPGARAHVFEVPDRRRNNVKAFHLNGLVITPIREIVRYKRLPANPAGGNFS